MSKINVLEVNTSNFIENVNKIKKYYKDYTIMPILKDNSYGTYINTKLELIKDFDIIGVSRVDEAISLRKIGYKNDIFVLNQPLIDELDNIIKYKITIGISEKEFINKLVNINKKVKVHLEIETGMNRTGIFIKDLDNIIKLLKQNNKIIIEGVYSHLSQADNNKIYTNKQIDIFNESLNIIKDNNIKIKYKHLFATSGINNYIDKYFSTNLIRPGMLLYGYSDNKLDLKPVCKLRSKITYIKYLSKDSYISYNNTYKCKKNMKVATISIGYGDGINRLLSNRGYVVINNNKCKIIGSICMDSLMVDITNIDCNIGDNVYIFDNNIIKVSDISKLLNTINYEILVNINNRVERMFVS